MNYFVRLILIPGLVTIAYFYGHLLFQDIGPVPKNPHMVQTQLIKPGPVIGSVNGTPEEFGYMTTVIKDFNEHKLLPWQQLRMKRWDAFDIITDEVVVSLTIADVLYSGEIKLAYFDYATRQYKNYKKMLLPFGGVKLSNTSYKFTSEHAHDNIAFDDGDLSFKIENLGHDSASKENARKITITSKTLGLSLNAKLSVAPDHQSMVAIVPLAPELQHFFYTIKMPNIQSEGSLTIQNQVYQITKKNAGGFIDWGRGVWTYNTYWVFARAQGYLDGKRFSLGFASGYGDNETSTATEDAFFIDNTMYKLNMVDAGFDDYNLMNPWTFKTVGESKKSLGECEIIFQPHQQNQNSLNVLFIKNDMRIAYGQYSGWVTDEKGKKHTFENVNGFAEVYKAKW